MQLHLQCSCSVLFGQTPVSYRGKFNCNVNQKNGSRYDLIRACALFSTSLWATDHYQPLRMFAGHLADITCTRFHPNSNYIVTGSSDRTIRLWDVLTGNCVRILTGHKVRQLTGARIVWVPIYSVFELSFMMVYNSSTYFLSDVTMYLLDFFWWNKINSRGHC